MSRLPVDPVAIDVGRVLRETVRSVYAHLVTRPTGRAVRLAIETRLETAGPSALSLIDLSAIRILDFSCADEVVAKLLQRYGGGEGPAPCFVFRGVFEPHREQVEYVLDRQGLVAVAETTPGAFELLGSCREPERKAWAWLEASGFVTGDQSPPGPGPGPHDDALENLIRRRVAFRSLVSGKTHALSYLVRHLL